MENVFHGIPWKTFHGIPWNSMPNTRQNSMEFHGKSSMEFHGIPWGYFTRVTMRNERSKIITDIKNEFGTQQLPTSLEYSASL